MMMLFGWHVLRRGLIFDDVLDSWGPEGSGVANMAVVRAPSVL